MKKPEIQDILNAKIRREALYSHLREDQNMAVNVYEGEQDIGITKPYSAIRTPRARNLIDVPCDHVISDNPIVKVKPRNLTQKYQVEADLHEKFQQGWLLTLLPHLRKKSKFLFALGEAYDKILVDYEKMKKIEDEPDKSDKDAHALWEVQVFDSFPLIVSCPHPCTIYPHPDEVNCRPFDVFEIYDRDCFEVEEKWAGSIDGFSQMHYGDTVQWIEWWTADWRCFMTSQGEGKDVQYNYVFGMDEKAIQKNVYGFVPYRHANAGYGLDWDTFQPHRRIKSILYPSYDIIKFENRVFSQLDTILTKFAHPTPVKSGTWDSSKIDYSPGKEIELPDGKFWGKDFEIIPGPAPDPSLFNTLGLLANFFEQVQPGVVRGQATSASSPAYAEEGRTGQARLKYGGPLMAMEETTAGILSDGLRLIETVIKKPLTVHGAGDNNNYLQTIKPEDINGYYLCTVDMEAKDPSLSNQKQMLGLRRYEAGTLSLVDFLQDYANTPNATEKIGLLEAEKIAREDPMMKAAYVKRALQAVGAEEELAIIKAQEEKQKSMDEWQSKKQSQGLGNPTLNAQQYIQEGNMPNGKPMAGEEQGRGIPRLDNVQGMSPLTGGMPNV